jgi:hypothetical protein
MGYFKLGASAALVSLVLAPAQAMAQTAQASAGVTGTATATGGSSEFFDNYSVRLGLQAAGPLLFRDAPDGRVEETTVFPFGPRLALLFGHELRNIHRAGLGLSYLFVGDSESRSLSFIPIYLLHEIGHPLILQSALGANLTAGTEGFADNYTGVHTALALRYSFIEADRWFPVTVSPGITAQANLVPDDMQYSTVFLGAQVEIMYNTNN